MLRELRNRVRGRQSFFGVLTLSLLITGILLTQSVFASRVILKDELQLHRALLHAAAGHGHACDCYSPYIDTVKIFNLSSTGFSMSWYCDDPSSYQVRYGLTASTKTTYFPAVRPTVGYKKCTVNVVGLTPNTIYHAGPVSKCLVNCGGTRASAIRMSQRRPKSQNDWVIQTLQSGSVSVLENSPQASSGYIISQARVTDLTAQDVTISWTTRNPSSSFIDYGITDKYGSSSGVNEVLDRSHRIQLFNLPLGTTFHARAGSTDANGTTVYTADFTFKTPVSEARVVNLTSVFNEPNPCFERTVINYRLFQPVERVTIDILTISGKNVANLEAPKSTLKQGDNKVLWDVRDNSGKRLSEGLYLYQITFYSFDHQAQVAKSYLMVRK